jgi:hypothetical protein
VAVAAAAADAAAASFLPPNKPPPLMPNSVDADELSGWLYLGRPKPPLREKDIAETNPVVPPLAASSNDSTICETIAMVAPQKTLKCGRLWML